MRRSVVVLAALLGTAACARRSETTAFLPAEHMVDLTHSFNEQTLYWPTSPSGFVRQNLFFGKTPGGFFYSSGAFAAPEHGGTHLDAPIHFAEGKSSADGVPLTRLVGPAVVLDVSARAATDPDALLASVDVDEFERRHGAIAAGTIVLVRTGWAARWPNRKAYFGDDTPGDASHLHFPGIGADAARALSERRVAAVGIDTASIDYGPSIDFKAHQILLGADIPAFENLADLSTLPPRGAWLIALPMKIQSGSGGPLRVIAILPAEHPG